MPRNGAGDSEAGNTVGIIRLVMGIRHDQHGPTGSHRLRGRSDSALVKRWRRLVEKVRERG